MASDIEHQSAAQQEMVQMDDDKTDHHPCEHDSEKPASCSWSCLQLFSLPSSRNIYKKFTYVLAAVLYAFLVLHPVPVAKSKAYINPDYIAKSALVAAFSLPFQAMVIYSLPAKIILGKDAFGSSKATGMAGTYNLSRRKETIFQRLAKTFMGPFARTGLLVFVWLVLTVKVPRLKRMTLLGSPVWRWSLLAVYTISYYFQALTVYLIPALSFQLTGWLFERNQLTRIIPHEYFYVGLFPSTTLVIYLGMTLGTWMYYFNTENGLVHASNPHPEAFEYVTWTCVGLLVGSILCFFKTFMLLKWSADAIYRRFQPRILITGVKYLYLGLIVGGFFENEFIAELEVLEEYSRQSDPTKFSFTNYIMSKDMDISYLGGVGRTLASLATVVRSQREDGVPDVIEFFENKITRTHDKCELEDLVELLSCLDLSPRKNLAAREWLRKMIGLLARNFEKPTAENFNTTGGHSIPSIQEQFSQEEYRKKTATVLYGIVREQCSSDDITFDDLKKWMVDAHINCVNMGRTLVDANAMVTRLDIFISLIICIAVVLLWLLITGIATTTVLVTIATPLLALTFIFGDSAKTFFQGIIFCFGTHAFDVGDRCILDKTELEVKSIGILATTFIKIGSMEKRMYPNSVLATKAIANLGWQPDPSDAVELTLDLSTTPTDLKVLEEKIQKFFNYPRKESGSFEKNTHEVVMKEIGNKIKVTIHFRHVLNIKEMTHKQCWEKKNKQRSIFLKTINHFLHGGGWEDSSQHTEPIPIPIPISPLTRVRSWS